jgi:hypothetical protein
VALEQSRGALIFMLGKYEHLRGRRDYYLEALIFGWLFRVINDENLDGAFYRALLGSRSRFRTQRALLSCLDARRKS